ncbi:MAG: hypothetical protein ABSC06_20530 [Rhodopila sp.]
MSTDRKTLLLQHSNALAAMRNQDLPEDIRALAKQAADKSAVLLGLQDAMERKKVRDAAANPSTDLPPAA